jgi:transcriptional regulator with XRE-family HTH domain
MDIAPLDIHVGNQLRIMRKSLKLSQRDLANKASISLRQIQKYEDGLNKIGTTRLYTFANLLNVDILYFFNGYIDNKNNPNSPLNNIDSRETEMVNELISTFLMLPAPTQENLLRLVKDLEEKDYSNDLPSVKSA